jgi:hypothetical protein
MTALTVLWLPILVSAVIVFVASSIIHMLPLWHKGDYSAPPNQDGVRDALRPFAILPGDYMIPRASDMKELKTPEFIEKMTKGPIMMLTVVRNGPMGMGQNLVSWFIYCVVVSFFAAYISSRALTPGTDYLQVFRFAGATSFLAYAVGMWQMSIWYHRSWSLTIKSTMDGLLYALLTAGTFGWLWPR